MTRSSDPRRPPPLSACRSHAWTCQSVTANAEAGAGPSPSASTTSNPAARRAAETPLLPGCPFAGSAAAVVVEPWPTEEESVNESSVVVTGASALGFDAVESVEHEAISDIATRTTHHLVRRISSNPPPRPAPGLEGYQNDGAGQADREHPRLGVHRFGSPKARPSRMRQSLGANCPDAPSDLLPERTHARTRERPIGGTAPGSSPRRMAVTGTTAAGPGHSSKDRVSE